MYIIQRVQDEVLGPFRSPSTGSSLLSSQEVRKDILIQFPRIIIISFLFVCLNIDCVIHCGIYAGTLFVGGLCSCLDDVDVLYCIVKVKLFTYQNIAFVAG